MFLHRISFSEPAENLAFDEALLETADLAWSDGDDSVPECLRLWEPKAPMVVLGRSSPLDGEVNRSYCQQHGIPVLRRCSGGATIVTGPGCLMYAVVLRYADKPELRMLDQAHQFVMNQMRLAIESLGISVRIQGISDLTIGDRKVSGNSLRCRRHALLYHGTLICDFDLGLVARCLKMPKRQPAYREGRTHDEFLTRIPSSTADLAEAVARHWKADHISTLDRTIESAGIGVSFLGDSARCGGLLTPDDSRFQQALPLEMTLRLTTEKYLTQAWLEAV